VSKETDNWIIIAWQPGCDIRSATVEDGVYMSKIMALEVARALQSGKIKSHYRGGNEFFLARLEPIGASSGAPLSPGSKPSSP